MEIPITHIFTFAHRYDTDSFTDFTVFLFKKIVDTILTIFRMVSRLLVQMVINGY